MSYFPEMPLEPPEPVEFGKCPVCGGEIYEGDACWKKENEYICLWHFDAVVADWLGWHKAEAI